MPNNNQLINVDKIPDRIEAIRNGEDIEFVKKGVSRCRTKLEKVYRSPTRIFVIKFCSLKNEINLDVKENNLKVSEINRSMDTTPLAAILIRLWSKCFPKHRSSIKSITAQ